VTSLYIVASLLTSRGLGPFVGGWQNKNKENPMTVAHPTQRLLHVLPMFILQNSRVSWCFLVCLPRVLLASFFIFRDRVLPSVGGIFRLTCCHCTKVSKSCEYARPTTTRDMVASWCWCCYGHWCYRFQSFAIERVGVDEIEKERLREVKG
jgi:hypothetical protein